MTPRRKKEPVIKQYWEIIERDETDREDGLLLCDVCKKEDTLQIYVHDIDGRKTPLKERCSDGCYVHTY